jgi:hypothetical protein
MDNETGYGAGYSTYFLTTVSDLFRKQCTTTGRITSDGQQSEMMYLFPLMNMVNGYVVS